MTPASEVSFRKAATTGLRHDVTAGRPTPQWGTRHVPSNNFSIPSLIWSLTIARGVEPEISWTLLPVTSVQGLAAFSYLTQWGISFSQTQSFQRALQPRLSCTSPDANLFMWTSPSSMVSSGIAREKCSRTIVCYSVVKQSLTR